MLISQMEFPNAGSSGHTPPLVRWPVLATCLLQEAQCTPSRGTAPGRAQPGVLTSPPAPRALAVAGPCPEPSLTPAQSAWRETRPPVLFFAEPSSVLTMSSQICQERGSVLSSSTGESGDRNFPEQAALGSRSGAVSLPRSSCSGSSHPRWWQSAGPSWEHSYVQF